MSGEKESGLEHEEKRRRRRKKHTETEQHRTEELEGPEHMEDSGAMCGIVQ